MQSNHDIYLRNIEEKIVGIEADIPMFHKTLGLFTNLFLDDVDFTRYLIKLILEKDVPNDNREKLIEIQNSLILIEKFLSRLKVTT